MKKILYVTTVSLTLNTFLIPHIRRLKERGYDVQVASNIDVPINNDFEIMEVKHTKIDFSRNPLHFNNIRAYNQILKLYEKEKFDIIHVHTPVASFVTRYALRNKNVRMIYTAHGFHFYKGAPIINWGVYYPLEKIAARWTDKLVTINGEDFERAKKFNLRENGKIELMHGVGIKPNDYEINQINRESYRENLGLDKEDFIVLILAELNKNKNHIQAINAMRILSDKYTNIKLICAGKGPLENELKNTIKKFDLEGNVKFIGFRKDVKELLNISDCVALFSYREGLGKCLLEGMITNNALLATDTRGPREIIENKHNGYLVKVGDYKETAECIEKLYLDRSLYNKFVENSKMKVEIFSINNVLSEIEKYYIEESYE